MKVPVAAILLLSTILVQATPVKKREASAAPFDPFAHMVQTFISDNDFYALCDLTKNLQTSNLFTTSESPNIRVPILQIFVFVYWRGTRKQKQIFGELEFEYFGVSDVVNKLIVSQIRDWELMDTCTCFILIFLCF